MDAELQNLFLAGLTELMNSPPFTPSLLGFTRLAFHSQSRMSLDCKHGHKFEGNEKHNIHALYHAAWRIDQRKNCLGLKLREQSLSSGSAAKCPFGLREVMFSSWGSDSSS